MSLVCIMTHFNSKALVTFDSNYSCHIKAIEFVKPIIWAHITSLVMDSLGGMDTHTHTHTHTHIHTHTHTHTCTHTNYKCIPTLQIIAIIRN